MLIVKIQVNEYVIGTVTAQRVKGSAKPDSLNTYVINDDPKIKIKHRYGDGAVELVKKILSYTAIKPL